VSFSALLVIVAPVFLIITAGYIVRRAEWLSAEAGSFFARRSERS
jgi:predicted permease